MKVTKILIKTVLLFVIVFVLIGSAAATYEATNSGLFAGVVFWLPLSLFFKFKDTVTNGLVSIIEKYYGDTSESQKKKESTK